MLLLLLLLALAGAGASQAAAPPTNPAATENASAAESQPGNAGAPGAAQEGRTDLRLLALVAGATVMLILVLITWNRTLGQAVSRRTADLAESEQRFRLIMDNLADLVALLDLEGRRLYNSPSYREILGDPEQLRGTDSFTEIHPDDRERVRQVFRETLRTGVGQRLEYRLVDRTGQARQIESQGSVIRDASGNVAKVVVVSRDITERKREAETHARLATAVEQAAEAIVVTDTQGTILYVNPAFERTTGYTRAEAVGQNPRILKSGRHDAEYYRAMWGTLLQGRVWSSRIVNKKKNGLLFEEETTISPVRDASGRVVNYVAVKRDVTQEVALEAQLRQSQKMEAIGQLAGGVAHDFNNILTVIHGNASLLLNAETGSPDESEWADQILRAAERAGNLTRQLLLFSRKQVPQPANVSLNEIVVGMVKMLQRILGEDIDVVSELTPELPLIRADTGMIEQVLLNLAVNARDAMPGGGNLTIATARLTLEAQQTRHPRATPGGYVRLSVCDTGCGMSPEIQQHIFEPFFTTKEPGQGTGLGLATVYSIVQQHQGWLDVVSEIGRGATFHVYFPAVAAPAAEPKAATGNAQLPRGTETVLVVEDELSLRLLVSRVLERCGYTVLSAHSGAAALQVWQEHQGAIALLLTDVVMPEGINGFELARRLQAQKPALKVIYTSGYTAKAGEGPELVEGVNFFQKPYSSRRLAQSVRTRLDQKL